MCRFPQRQPAMSSPDHSDPPRDDEHLPLHALLAPGADLPPVERFPPFQPEDDPLQALVAELRNYQRELEIQNRVLDYSQAVAESASERFERSEEHTSELQSPCNLVCRLLLEQ